MSEQDLSNKTIWDRCLDKLRDEISPNLFTLWMRPLDAEENGATLSLYAPNSYFVIHITATYLDRIRDLVLECSQGKITDVQMKYDPKRDFIHLNVRAGSPVQNKAEKIPDEKMVWTACLEKLRHEIPPNLYTLWILPLAAEESDAELFLYAPNSYFVKHISEAYFDRIRELVFEFSQGRITDVQMKYDQKRDFFNIK